MSILDFTDENWQGETGDISRIIAIEQENYTDEPDWASEINRLATADATGVYRYQTGLNPDSDLAARPNFIENPALSGNLTAKARSLGQIDLVGTIYLPLTRSIHPFIRNILQSRGWTTVPVATDTIVRIPASPVGNLTTAVVAAATTLQATTIAVGDITGSTGTAPARLTVTLAAFSSTGANRDVAAGGNGVITLTGTDHWGTTLTEEILIPANSAAAATFESQYYWKDVDTVVTSGFLTSGAGTFGITGVD